MLGLAEGELVGPPVQGAPFSVQFSGVEPPGAPMKPKVADAPAARPPLQEGFLNV
ncbi:hypothetical protein GCM10027161_01140 [Microbispora hainanensis]